MIRGRSMVAITAGAVMALLAGRASAFDPAAGDFAKTNANDIRVLEYNIEDYFYTNTAVTNAALKRVFQAVNPDIIVMEELEKTVTASQVKATLEGYFPGSTWTVQLGATDGYDRNVLATRHALSLTITDTTPPSDTGIGLRGVTGGLVTTTNSGAMYVMGVHWKCCTSGATDHQKRQRAADGAISWMRDARNAGGFITLANGTPMLVVGDYNVGQDDNADESPYHASTTILNGDIYDNASYGVDSPPDWDGTNSTDAVPYDHVNGDPRTWPSSAATSSRLDRFTYTDSVTHVTNRFVISTRTMSAPALLAAGLTATDTNTTGGPDHLPTIVDFAPGAETTTVGQPIINEFSYNDIGTDDRSFLELINTGTRELNLEAPVAYRFLRSDNNAPTVIPAAENESSNTFSLRGVIPPGGLFVVYNSAGQSSTVAATITGFLPALQRQNTTAFSLFDGPTAGIAIVRNDRTSDGANVYTNIDAYLYEDAAPTQDNYLLTNTPGGGVITFGAGQSISTALLSDTLTLSRNVGDFSANNFSGWTNPDTGTPGQPNNTTVSTPSPTASPSPAATASATPTSTPTPSATTTPTVSVSPTTSPTISASASASPTPSFTPSMTPVITASSSPTPTPTPNTNTSFVLY